MVEGVRWAEGLCEGGFVIVDLILGAGRLDRVISDAEVLLAEYPAEDGLRYLNWKPSTAPDHLSPEDLAVTILINSRVGPAAFRSVQDHGAGDLDTRLEPLPVDDPIGAADWRLDGAELARRRPGLFSIDCVYGPGQFYNLGPRRSDLDGLRGQHLDRPRLIIQQGALLLQVPSPREATAPHRELPRPSRA
jgi:hypothetical protein